MSHTSTGVPPTESTWRVAAQHDDQVCGPDHVVGELPGLLVGDVDADLEQCLRGQGVDVVAGFACPPTRRATVSPTTWRIRPAAIWDLPPFFTHTNSTAGFTGVESWVALTEVTCSGLRREQLGQQFLDTAADVVPDPADHVDALPGGVFQFPVLVPFPGEDRGRRRRSPW